MRSKFCLLSTLGVLLCGCRPSTASLAQFAEQARSSTERMAVATERENEQREQEGVQDIAEMRSPPPVKLVERYETRQGPDGLFVYDTETHSVATLGNQPQAGLNLRQADQAVEALSALDAKGSSH